MSSPIRYFFVLMLENHSFDHMLGFADITGTDAVTGKSTRANGLPRKEISLLQVVQRASTTKLSQLVNKEGCASVKRPLSIYEMLQSNVYGDKLFPANQPAGFAMPVDPNHEFPDVLEQLCGPGSTYSSSRPFPPMTNSGFIASYMASPMPDDASRGPEPGQIMQCLSPDQVPVITQLAREFVVCDNWHASMPGPTIPNRLFAYGASSGGLDNSPSGLQIAAWCTFDGFSFANGSIWDRLSSANINWRIYGGDYYTTQILANVDTFCFYSQFASDLANPGYPEGYTFIEPFYDPFNDYICGASQHPLNDITRGETLIKATYEAIRNSPVWESSMLLITWDEHGGFYDHVAPPAALAPGDAPEDDDINQYGFTFEQYGVRVPAVVVSPLIPKNLVDHRLYDHSSIPATLEGIYNLPPLTHRDAQANKLMALVSLSKPRTDTPTHLVEPSVSGITGTGCDAVMALYEDEFKVAQALERAGSVAPITEKPIGTAHSLSNISPPAVSKLSRPADPIAGNLPCFLFGALKHELKGASPDQRQKSLANFKTLKTRQDAF